MEVSDESESDASFFTTTTTEASSSGYAAAAGGSTSEAVSLAFIHTCTVQYFFYLCELCFFFLILCLHVPVLLNLSFCEFFFSLLVHIIPVLYSYCFGEQNMVLSEPGFPIDTDTGLK